MTLAVIDRYTEANGDGGYMFNCPGCGHLHCIPVGSGSGPRWGVNQSLERPTFTPSILVRSTYAEPPVTSESLDDWKRAPWPQTKVERVCHSYVTDGQIQFLGDCTHALAGQTVALPVYVEED
jgi:hypothetical protein